MSNSIDPVVAKRWVGEIRKHHEELLSLRGTYMNDCRLVREDIKDCMESAKNAGIPRKALKAVLKKMDLEAKIEAITEDFEEEDVEQVELLEAALGDFGDTPLGSSAIDKAEARQKERASKVQSLVGDPAATNVERLKGGIKPLDAKH